MAEVLLTREAIDAMGALLSIDIEDTGLRTEVFSTLIRGALGPEAVDIPTEAFDAPLAHHRETVMSRCPRG